MQDFDGVKCIKCNKSFILSDPKIYELNALPPYYGLCSGCWIIIGERTLWGAETEKRVVFEVVKVQIPYSLRRQVWERDGFRCKLCGADKDLTVDHVKPESLGGSLTIENLQTLCRSCNSTKSNKLLE